MRAVGKVVLDREAKMYLITCEPHVMQRLKRVFERIPKDRLGTAPLADTQANADELRWFLDRFSLAMSPEDREHLDRQSAAHVEQQSIVDRVLAAGYTPRTFEMAVPPRGYQRIAADLALTQRHLLLADDMGLGKTISALAVLSERRSLPAIVVCPPNLAIQWEGQIRRCLPACNVHAIAKGTPYDLTVGKRNKPVPMPDIVIVSYAMFVGWAETFVALGFRSVVYDEIQALRHEFSKPGVRTNRYAAALFLRDRMALRLGLSGTPIYNRGGEIRNVLNTLSEDPVGSAAEFGRDFCKGASSDKADVADPDALGSLLRARGLMLRRSRADVGHELPALSIIAQPIESDPTALKTVNDSVAMLARRLLEDGHDGVDKLEAARDIDWKLRQATGIGKAPFVADFVRILVEQGDSVLLFGWHRAVYEIWKDRLHDLGIAFFTGEESPKRKAAAIDAFRSGKVKILAMSLRAAEGVDGLQDVCSTVVFGELDWSPGVMAQDIARSHRDGQTKPVFAYVLLADDGCDPPMAEVLNVKQAQADGIFNPGIASVERIAEEDQHRIRSLAEAYLAKHDPGALDGIRAENARRTEAKRAAKEAARADRRVGRSPLPQSAPAHTSDT